MSSAKERRRERLVGQAEAALEQLAADPHNHVAKGSLHEAVGGLEPLLGDDDGALREHLIVRPRETHLEPPLPALPVRTDRLLLRQRTSTDTPALHAIYSRADVAEHLLTPPLELDEVEEMLADRASRENGGFGLLLDLDSVVIGEVELMFRGPTQAELSWVVHPDHGGRGLVTEATQALIGLGFDHCGLHRIYAELDARNNPSARLCERLGMRLESHRLQDYWSKGEWTDTLQYAVLASEWG